MVLFPDSPAPAEKQESGMSIRCCLKPETPTPLGPPAQGGRAVGTSAIREELPASARADAWMGTGNVRAKRGEGKGEPGWDLARNYTCSRP